MSREQERSSKCQNKERTGGHGLCEFHDKDHASNENNKKEMIRLLKQKIAEANANPLGKPLDLTGYHIPEIWFDDKFEFKVEIYFNYVNFIGDVHFGNCTFARIAHFYESTFNGVADFSEVKFNENANFYEATFNGEVTFSEATFKELVTFMGATFKEQAIFSEVTFNGEAIFTAATFNKRTFIFNCLFQKIMCFNYVLLINQEHIIFNGNLSRVSFANTDITRVRFGDKVVWGRKDRNLLKYRSEVDTNDKNKLAKEAKIHFKMCDEWLLEEDVANKNKKPSSSLEAVITEYRNLRENYEYSMRYEEAGQFFIREMELRRKYGQKLSSPAEELPTYNKIEEKNPLERIFSFAALYYAVSNYGESNIRPFIIIAGIFVAATVYYWYFLHGGLMDIAKVSDSISRTLTAFFPFLNLPPNSGLLEIFLKATALVFTGLFIVTLRRKLERRFRH